MAKEINKLVLDLIFDMRGKNISVEELSKGIEVAERTLYANLSGENAMSINTYSKCIDYVGNWTNL